MNDGNGLVLADPLADVAGEVFERIAGFGKDPYQLSLETVRTFKSDSEAAGFSL